MSEQPDAPELRADPRLTQVRPLNHRMPVHPMPGARTHAEPWIPGGDPSEAPGTEAAGEQGIRAALVGLAWVVLGAVLAAIPIGVIIAAVAFFTSRMP